MVLLEDRCRPIDSTAFPCAPPGFVARVAVPEHFAVPLKSFAEVEADESPYAVSFTSNVTRLQLPAARNNRSGSIWPERFPKYGGVMRV